MAALEPLPCRHFDTFRRRSIVAFKPQISETIVQNILVSYHCICIAYEDDVVHVAEISRRQDLRAFFIQLPHHEIAAKMREHGAGEDAAIVRGPSPRPAQ